MMTRQEMSMLFVRHIRNAITDAADEICETHPFDGEVLFAASNGAIAAIVDFLLVHIEQSDADADIEAMLQNHVSNWMRETRAFITKYGRDTPHRIPNRVSN